MIDGCSGPFTVTVEHGSAHCYFVQEGVGKNGI